MCWHSSCWACSCFHFSTRKFAGRTRLGLFPPLGLAMYVVLRKTLRWIKTCRPIQSQSRIKQTLKSLHVSHTWSYQYPFGLNDVCTSSFVHKSTTCSAPRLPSCVRILPSFRNTRRISSLQSCETRSSRSNCHCITSTSPRPETGTT